MKCAAIERCANKNIKAAIIALNLIANSKKEKKKRRKKEKEDASLIAEWLSAHDKHKGDSACEEKCLKKIKEYLKKIFQ